MLSKWSGMTLEAVLLEVLSNKAELCSLVSLFDRYKPPNRDRQIYVHVDVNDVDNLTSMLMRKRGIEEIILYAKKGLMLNSIS